VQQAFQVGFQLDKHAEVGQLGDGALDDLAGDVLFGDRPNPRVFGQLLDAQRDAVLFFVDFQHDALDFLTLLQGLAGVVVLLGPAQVRDVNQPSMPGSISTNAP
jgi:hypothetical protein